MTDAPAAAPAPAGTEAALPHGRAASVRLAAAVFGLSCVTHDDTPVVRVLPEDAPPRTLAVPVDPTADFAALVTAVEQAPHTDAATDLVVRLGAGPTGAARPTGSAGGTGLAEATDPAGDVRLALTVTDDGARCAHNGTPGAALDARTLESLYGTVLDRARTGDSGPVGAYDLLTGAERDRVLREFNDTARDFPDRTTLHAIFHAQAVRTPDAVAVSTDRASLTYRELDERTDRLAHHLVARGVVPGTIVAVHAQRCLDLPVALLAVLKAGGAYLPLDPTAPARRNAELVDRSGAPIVLAQPGTDVPDGIAATVLRLDDPDLYAGPAPGPQDHAGPEDLAYVIYTSGSTGKPKGVMVEHRSVVNRLTWMQRRYPLTAEDTLLQKTPVIFDVSVWELFWWFFAGARLHLLAPGMERFPLAIGKTVRQQRITALHFVPSMLGMFLEHLQDGGEPAMPGLRWCFSSGESLPASSVAAFGRLLGPQGTTLVNLYGPTEATVDVTGHDCPATPPDGPVPIGRPIDNTRVYVLRHGRPVPVGVYGTLFLAGAGVARGYLGDPDLTARKFVPEFGGGNGRMYDSGDIGRWLPSGELEFLGRDDSQVKIRGIRIDLGEIEGVLLEVPGVTECAVLLDRPDPLHPVLRAAVSTTGDLSEADLREHAAQRLPQYMLPTVHHRFEKLPRTGSGKTDRRTLADPAYAEANALAW
ncbi:amino acid adenylation domain-containing protein [Streptomyces sp. NPDC045470]|uniref:non-ribosomal peptide synthetase n=1 Tax=unclassified Streptomyces TaxID=2593676 RepID=UPI0033E5D629